MQSNTMQGMTTAPFIGEAVSAEEQLGALHRREQPLSSVFGLAPIPMALTSLPEDIFIEVNREFLGSLEIVYGDPD